MISLAELAAHHNAVSADFKGIFQDIPLRCIKELQAESLDEGTSHIAAALEGDRIAGFCKADISEDKGKIDYLIVSEMMQSAYMKNTDSGPNLC